MSYIPPHKRQLKDPVSPSPFPDSLATKVMKNTDFKSSSVKVNIAYSRDAIFKWFLIGSKGISDEVPPSIKLVPVSSDSSDSRYGEKSFVLMNTNVEKGNTKNVIAEESEEEERTRWMLIAEKVEKDLVVAYEQAKKGMQDHHLSDNAKLRLVARFGKILFRRIHAGPVTEYWQAKSSNRTFCTDVPTSFIQNIKSKAIPSHEFCIDLEKEVYVVQISHYTRPHSTIICKCTVKEDGSLSMYKARLEPFLHLVVDVSCIDKNLDMRFMLAGKRKMFTLTEKERSNIQRMLDSVTVDSTVKGGLTWPHGKPPSENGYTIFEVCHVRATTYKNKTLRLRVRETNGYSERFGTWEVERGVTLILQDINTKLQELRNFKRLSGSDMSYIPPHKRHSKDPDRPSPVPDSLATKFKKNLHFNASSSDKRDRIIYSGDSITKWFLIGSNGIEDEIPLSAKLVPLSSDSVLCKKGIKPSILMSINDHNESREEEERTRWLLIAEKVQEDLVLAYERAKTAMDGENQHVLRLVASFGNNFFYGQKPSNKIFSTDVPTSYLHHIKSHLVPRHGLCIDLEKERYTVKVSHYTRPNETINCKCTVKEDGRLSMYKASLKFLLCLCLLMSYMKACVLFLEQVEHNQIRHLLVDVSCIDKNLDMRLMLAAKRKITSLTEKEISDIKGLLDSATVDPNAKGGLRWPFGKSSSGDGYSVFESCHVKATVYKNQTLRLRVRETDRYNERIGTGEVKREVILMLKDMNSKLQEQNIDRGCVLEMLRDVLGTLWDFLHCEAYLT
ncbi:unnamed protein product [Brassica rapa subsp. narinosa]